MNDFDEVSRRDRDRRRTRRIDGDPDEPRVSRLINRDDINATDEDDVEWGRPVNPEWRKERTTRARGRGSTGAFYSSPQEFRIWLQKGGWMAVAGVAVLVIGILIFLLLRSGGEERTASGVFAPDPTEFAAAQEESSGIFTAEDTTGSTGDTATGEDGAGVSDVPVQPTVTPGQGNSPASATADAFVVTGTGTQGLFLRSAPGTDTDIVATLPEGTRVEQIGEDNIGPNYVWRNVRAPEGQEGWVAVDWLQPDPGP